MFSILLWITSSAEFNAPKRSVGRGDEVDTLRALLKTLFIGKEVYLPYRSYKQYIERCVLERSRRF